MKSNKVHIAASYCEQPTASTVHIFYVYGLSTLITISSVMLKTSVPGAVFIAVLRVIMLSFVMPFTTLYFFVTQEWAL
jgi:hypothetical protein